MMKCFFRFYLLWCSVYVLAGSSDVIEDVDVGKSALSRYTNDELKFLVGVTDDEVKRERCVSHPRAFLATPEGFQYTWQKEIKKIQDAQTDVVAFADQVRKKMAYFVELKKKEGYVIKKCWFDSLNSLDVLAKNWVPDDMKKAQAFMRISLYLRLRDSFSARGCWFGYTAPKLEGCFKDLLRMYMDNGDQYTYAFGDDTDVSVLSHFASSEENKVLVVLPNKWEPFEEDARINVDLTGFFGKFYELIEKAYIVHNNALIMEAAHRGLYKSLAQGFFKEMETHWQTDGVKRGLVGYQLLYGFWRPKMAIGKAFLDYVVSVGVKENLTCLLLQYVRNNPPRLKSAMSVLIQKAFDGCCLDVLCINESQVQEKFLSGCRGVFLQVAHGIKGVNMRGRQKEIITQLEGSWQEKDLIVGDGASYQRILLRMVESVCAEEGLWYMLKSLQKFCSSHNNEQEEVFCILVDKALFCPMYCTKRKAKTVVLQSTIKTMSSYQRRLLLVELLRESLDAVNVEEDIILPFYPGFEKAINHLIIS